MSILDQVETLRKQAVDLLLAERNLIDEKLVAFGHGEGIKPRRPPENRPYVATSKPANGTEPGQEYL
jgi:hypothetical protein